MERSFVLTGLMCVTAVAWPEGVHGALAVLVAAALVQGAIACELALLVQRRRGSARGLIIDGRGDLPFEPVQRERRRLQERSCCENLARSLDEVRDIAAHPVSWPPAARPLFSVRVVAGVENELARIAARLRAGPVGVRGVAMLERLLTQGTSAFYGSDIHALREELRRILFLIDG